MLSSTASQLLLFACNQGDVEQCQTLVLEGHASLEFRNTLGETCLHIACAAGHASVVELLLALGADPNVSTWPKFGAKTPLHIAVKSGRVRIVQTLLSRLADANIVDSMGRTPLHEAVIANHATLVELLLRHGATSECPDRFDKTPLDLAVNQCFTAAVALLTKPVADGEAPPPEPSFQQRLEAEDKRIVWLTTKAPA